ncbi:MAG: hypothetical protein II826_01515 [Prevotella sp.]|nr:hypothetical protein [Prevotella sp.]
MVDTLSVDLGLESNLLWAKIDVKGASGSSTFGWRPNDFLAAMKEEPFGEEWTIATQKDFQELSEACDWTAEDDGFHGISKANGNEIVLPYTGDGYSLYWNSSTSRSSYMYIYVEPRQKTVVFEAMSEADTEAKAVRAVRKKSQSPADDIGDDDPNYNGKYKRPQVVDLGLSVKWGSFNLGASSVTDFGGYFGWGDVTETLTVNDRGALYASGKFNTSIGGDVAYDIVAKELGGHWRMPTAKEIEELNTCTITFVKDYQNTGVKGWLFTRNGNSLFFPCAGYQDTGGLEDTQFAYIWSDSTYNSTYQAYSYRIYDNVSVKPANSMRNLHLSLRPVYDDGGSSDPGTSQGGGEVTPPVQNQDIPTDGIDMGLGVRWAPQNIGAKKSSEVGNYFAWGEIKTKDSFTEDNYVSPYKGIGRGDSGFQTIDAENDAATQLWGDKWRMPTMDEIGALRSTCTVSSPVTRDGVVGFVFKSNINGAELFFPAGGSKVGTNATHNSADMCYWTSTVYTSSLNEEQRVNWATCIKGNYSEDPYLHGTSRFYGLLIRPVMK